MFLNIFLEKLFMLKEIKYQKFLGFHHSFFFGSINLYKMTRREKINLENAK